MRGFSYGVQGAKKNPLHQGEGFIGFIILRCGLGFRLLLQPFPL